MSDVFSTKDFSLFILRDDNRDKISSDHLKAIKQSISECNLLYMRPIIVNESMEIIDGQHRFLAAKALNVPIYYEIQKDVTPMHMVRLNTSRSWSSSDYLNFYVKNGYQEYIKLNNYMKSHDLPINVVLSMMLGRVRAEHKEFRLGNFKFSFMYTHEQIGWCWRTIDLIRLRNGIVSSAYTKTCKFWAPLLKLVSHVNFNPEKWFINMEKMIENFSIRITQADYSKLFMKVHNYRNPNSICLVDEEY